MAESKLPFKTNLSQPLKTGQPKDPADSRAARGQARRAKLWGLPRKKIQGTKVDIRQERVERIKWFAKWVVIIPCSIYALSWVYLVFADLFGA